MERLMFGWDFEDDAWSRFWRWNLIKICVWTCDKNSTLGSAVPLAMFLVVRLKNNFSWNLLMWQCTLLLFSESQSSCWPTNRSRPGGRAAEEAGCKNPVACGFFPGQCWCCCRFVLWLECGLYSVPLTLFSPLTHMLQSRKKYKKAVSEHNALLEDPAELLRYNLNA